MKLFGVVGNPIRHSLSPLIHNHVIGELGVDAHYARILMPSSMDSAFFRDFLLDSDICGLNVTVPFKEVAYLTVDDRMGFSDEVRAVNCILSEGSVLTGYNTDVAAFQMCLRELNVRSALVIGAGGGSRGVCAALNHLGVDFCVTNRTPDRLNFFSDFAHTCDVDNIPYRSYDLIVNATSSSIYNTLPLKEDVIIDLFGRSAFAFDLAYMLDKPTVFCDVASQCRIPSMDGKDMLVFQGALSFIHFHGLDLSALDKIVSIMKDSLRIT